MIKKIIPLILMLFLVSNLIGRNDPNILVKNKITELQRNSVDTIIFYSLDLNRGLEIYLPDTCLCNYNNYLFWVKNGIFHCQRFDDCKIYKDIILLKSDFFDYFFTHLNEIKNTKIKKAIHKVNKNSEIRMSTSNTSITVFNFYVGKKHFAKTINHFDLETKEKNSTTNDNYKYNQNSVLNKLKIIVEKETNKCCPVGADMLSDP